MGSPDKLRGNNVPLFPDNNAKAYPGNKPAKSAKTFPDNPVKTSQNRFAKTFPDNNAKMSPDKNAETFLNNNARTFPDNNVNKWLEKSATTKLVMVVKLIILWSHSKAQIM